MKITDKEKFKVFIITLFLVYIITGLYTFIKSYLKQ